VNNCQGFLPEGGGTYIPCWRTARVSLFGRRFCLICALLTAVRIRPLYGVTDD